MTDEQDEQQEEDMYLRSAEKYFGDTLFCNADMALVNCGRANHLALVSIAKQLTRLNDLLEKRMEGHTD